VRKLAAVIAVVFGAFLCFHRAVVHEIVVDAAIGLACAAGLSLAVFGLVCLAGRKAVQPARQRAVAQPAAVERPRAGRPGDPCAEACGRPATRMFEQWPVCDEDGSRLDAVAEHARRPAVYRAAAELPAGDDLPHLTQPPVLPPGETIGQVDMTDFTEAHRND
jgi:hypothetical protein